MLPIVCEPRKIFARVFCTVRYKVSPWKPVQDVIFSFICIKQLFISAVIFPDISVNKVGYSC